MNFRRGGKLESRIGFITLGMKRKMKMTMRFRIIHISFKAGRRVRMKSRS